MGIMRKVPQPSPIRRSVRMAILGIRLNCFRLILSQGIAGYSLSEGLRS